MKNLQKLQDVAEMLAALNLEMPFSEIMNAVEKKMMSLEKLPLPVVYALPAIDGTLFYTESQRFCPRLKCSAVRLGQYCLDSSVNWGVKWEKQLDERTQDENAPIWQLPPLSLLSHLSKRVNEVNAVLAKFGACSLHPGWYRSCEQDENGVYKVFNINTGETALEANIQRFDICARLCYFCGE